MKGDLRVEGIRYGRNEYGQVTAIISPELAPIDQFLEDIGDSPVMWEKILDHLRHPSVEWGAGGNSCWITISSDNVIVENQFNDQSVAMRRIDFLEIAEAFTREVALARAERAERAADD
jgi:hypothetical protein